MAITGKFLADFTSFNDAVKKAEVSLKGMETDANKVGASLNRMVDQFSGRKLITDATLAAEAVERIGGATKLTEAEQQKLNATVTAAIAKYKALGQEAPESLQKIQRETDQIPPKMTAMQKAADIAKSSFGQMFGAFTAANLVSGALTSITSGLKNMAIAAVENAGAVVDMANATGLSIQTIQKFQGVAEQSGVSVETLTRSVFKLTTTLAKGGPEAKKAVEDLGLSFDDISRSSPDVAFDKIIAALEKMPPSFDRNLAIQQLFGKGATEVAKLVADKYSEMAKGVNTSTDEQIKALDRLGDAWTRLKRTAATSMGGYVADLVLAGEQAMKTPFWSLMLKLSTLGTQRTIAGLAGMGAVESKKKPEDVHLPTETPGKTTEDAKKLADAMAKLAESTRKAKEQWDAYVTSALKAGAAEMASNKKRAEAVEKVNHEMGLFVSKHLKDFGEAQQKILSGSGDAAVKLGLDWAGLHPVIEGLGKDFMEMSATGIQAARNMPPEIKKSTDALAELSQSLTQLATVSAGTFGTMVSSLASLVVGAKTARDSIASIKDAAKSTDKFESILGMTSGILGLVTVAMQAANAIKGIWNAIAGRGGRHAVEDFAESFGGFDALHAKLAELGDEGDRLWKSLTQGVGANNPAEAARVIAEVEAALAKQAEAQGEVTSATEEQAQATIETASQAMKALEELGPKIKTNEDEWKSWGDVVTAQIQRIADGIRALALPTMPGAAAIGAGAGGGSMAFSNKTTLILDGEVVGESVARQIMKA